MAPRPVRAWGGSSGAAGRVGIGGDPAFVEIVPSTQRRYWLVMVVTGFFLVLASVFDLPSGDHWKLLDGGAAAGRYTYVFVHIPKAGGTSFDEMMGVLFADLRRNLGPKRGPKYIGFHHADMSYVEGGCAYPVLERACRRRIFGPQARMTCEHTPPGCPQARTLLLLRRPVDRYVSHFRYSHRKKNKTAVPREVTRMQLEDLLDPRDDSRFHYSIAFVTGTSTEVEWVAHRDSRSLSAEEQRQRLGKMSDFAWMCSKAKAVVCLSIAGTCFVNNVQAHCAAGCHTIHLPH